MDLLQQSLSFASTWAFEDIGVQELEIELRLHLPEVSLHCEYSPGDEVLVFKGRLDNHHALIAKLVSTFIEKQKRKDLLDTPRIRPLALPIAVRESATNTGCSQTDSTDSLLALVDSNEIIPHHRTLVTKFWLSSTGGVGCFAASNHLKTLQDIAKATGTEISVPQGTKAIQVSGGNASDVDDALVKLTEIERPLSFICSPNISNIDVHPGEENARYKIQPAEESSSACVRRILIDPADALSGANVQLGQMFVTVFYSFDEETRKSTAAKSLLQPPTYSSELITPRPWSDFTFQELGDNDEYDPLDLALDNNVESRLVASVISDEHPFLSPEKAKEVGQWVVNDADLDAPDVAHEAKPEALDAHRPCPRSPRESPGSLEGAKRPGIKVRRPVQPVQATTAQDIKVHAPQAQPSAPEVISDRVTSTPRKKWKMTYEPTSDDPPRAQNSRAPSNFDDNTLGSLSQPAEEFTRSYLRQPGGKSPSPPFDAGNYGLRKKSTQLLKSVKNLQQAGKTSRDTPPLVRSNRTLEKNVLVDVALDDVVSLDSQLWQVGVSANAPALIPTVAEHSNAFGNLGSGSSMHSFSLQSRSHITDLLGSDLHEEASQGGSVCSVLLQDTLSNKENLPNQAARLQSLYAKYSNFPVTACSSTTSSCTLPGHANRLLENQVIEQYERAHRPEVEQCFRETQSRRFYQTMNQKTAKSCAKTMDKKTKQATLMDTWGISERKRETDGIPLCQNVSSVKGPNRSLINEREQKKQRVEEEQRAVRFREDIRRFFASMKSTLEAAESFPGHLSFEIQIGLVFIPSLPKTCNTDMLVSPSEWSKIVQPQNGVLAPSTKFLNRVTVCGSDINHIIDLKRSKAEGKSRIFEQDYSYYNVSYEFHCITRTGGLLIVALGEDGKYTIRNPSSVLGAVNLHFPKQIWDARAVVDSTAQYHPEINPEFDEAVKFLVDHVSIPATKTIRISTSLPNENKPTIKKVFMKRWTRHRFIRPGELSRDLDKGSDHGSQVGSIERTDTQDIFLQVTEVQDLLIHVDNKEDPRCVRAECKATVEMTRDGRLWYEVSLVSPALEAILKANMSLEVGERTKDWRAADLLGEHAALCGEDSSDSVAANPVAMAIGAGGVANLVELAKTLVPKIDGVGFSNAERTATGGNTEVSNGKSFKELDSVKEVESVAARIDQSGHVSQFAKREKFERDYW